MGFLVNSYRSAVAAGSALSNKWRINVSAVAGAAGNWTSVTEMEWALTPAGADQCSGGTPRASINESGVGTIYANSAFDNSLISQWQSGTATRPQWLGYEFATAITPTEVRLNCDVSPGDAPKDFTIDYWDSSSSSWITVSTVTGAVMATGFNTFTFSPNPAFTSGPSWTTDTGFYAEGDVATVSFTGVYTSTAIEWQRDGAAIGGATAASYTLTSGDVGHEVRPKVTLTIGTQSVDGYGSIHIIGTPTFATEDRVTNTGDQRVTSTGDVRIVSTRTA